jgi:hypothetical protein
VRVAERFLAIYLRDHLAGATVGHELARRTLANNRGTELEPALARLAGEIEEDRAALLRLMSELGVPPSRAKNALGWTLERAGRLKLNGRVLRRSPLSRLVELEGLTLGVTGKQALWSALERAGVAAQGVDLPELHRRADRQRRELEQLRQAVATEALEVPGGQAPGHAGGRPG